MVIRPATPADGAALGRLGGMLMRGHHAYDPQRFLTPGDDAEDGYASFLGSQLTEADVTVLVADVDGTVAGYVYAGIEPLSWKELRDECGYVHDLAVDPARRHHGVGRALLDAALDWLRARGMPRAMLWTAEPNDAAQRLFERRGFRRTMIEMTIELE